MRDTDRLKRGLKTEIEAAKAGELGRSVVLLLREDSLPLASITDERGVVRNKVVSPVDLLSMLDQSSVVEGLKQEATRVWSAPALPRNALLLDAVERPSGVTYFATGWIEAQSHTFVLDDRDGTSTHDLFLPHLVWRAVWDEAEARLRSLSLAVCSPELASEPTAETPLYRWPFSNVYGSFGGAAEGVCWPTMRDMPIRLSEVPEKAVKGFISIPNNADLYGVGRSQNSPYAGYREFLRAIEEEGLEHDYLIPTDLTVKDLHHQNERKAA